MVGIHPTAKVNFRGIRIYRGTRLEIGEGSIVEGSVVSERDGACIIIGKNTFIGGSLIASATKMKSETSLRLLGAHIVDTIRIHLTAKEYVATGIWEAPIRIYRTRL